MFGLSEQEKEQEADELKARIIRAKEAFSVCIPEQFLDGSLLRHDDVYSVLVEYGDRHGLVAIISALLVRIEALEAELKDG